MSKLLPLLLIVMGIAAGGAAGFFFRPVPDTEAAVPAEDDGHAATPAPSSSGHGDDHGEEEEGAVFVKLNNQFVIPVVKGGRVAALVVMSLNLEVGAGGREQVYSLEPKIRDALLTVLFEHANAGGFDGNFTASRNMDMLRRALTQASNQVMASNIVANVLVMDIVRQDV